MAQDPTWWSNHHNSNPSPLNKRTYFATAQMALAFSNENVKCSWSRGEQVKILQVREASKALGRGQRSGKTSLLLQLDEEGPWPWIQAIIYHSTTGYVLCDIRSGFVSRYAGRRGPVFSHHVETLNPVAFNGTCKSDVIIYGRNFFDVFKINLGMSHTITYLSFDRSFSRKRCAS